METDRENSFAREEVVKIIKAYDERKVHELGCYKNKAFQDSIRLVLTLAYTSEIWT